MKLNSVELVGIAERMNELAQNDPMSEDDQTEFIELGTVLASYIGSPDGDVRVMVVS